MKKLFTLLILFCVVVTTLRAQTATAPSGSGSSGDPYLVANLNNLYWITQNSASWTGKYFRQTANIDASATSSWDSNKGFLPIGNSTTNFTGNYDGGGFKITGLYINRPTSSDWNIGLFGSVSSPAIIQNIGVEAVNITGYWGVGGLAGSVYIGVSINNCYSTGNINCTQQAGGGLLGFSSGTVQKCYSTCSVSGIYNAGGFVGMTGKGTFTDCYSSGNVTLSDSGNGAAAFCGGANDYPNTFTNCYTIGSVTTASTTNIYAFIVPNGSNSNNCFYNYDTNNKSGGYATGTVTHEMQNQALYSGFDFVNTWRIDPTVNNGYPTLVWQGNANYALQPSGSGTSGDPYLIGSLPNLYWLHTQSGSSTMYYYKQTTDIDASATSSWCGGKGWVPIGLTNKSWIGNYDGQNFKISNLYINRTGTNGNYFGLFGLVSRNGKSCEFKNIDIANVSFTTSGSYVGALFGATLSDAYDVRITNCHSSGSISGKNITGGLIGSLYGASNYCGITKSYSTSSVTAYGGTADYLGGLIGYVYNGTYNFYIALDKCFARGAVSSNGNFVGGLVGQMVGVSNQTNYTLASFCYSTGTITSSSSYKGGLFGYTANHTLQYCYWDTQTSGQSSSYGGIGLSTTQMKTPSSYSNWDFTDTWYMKTGVNDGYPTYGRNAIPTITSFSPAKATPGTTVTISGTNFNATAASNIVYFGAAKATVTSGSETSLTVTVPAGATYEPITVLDAATAREARSTAYFMPTYPGKGTLAGNDFAPKTDFSQYAALTSMAVADFDGDGKPDMVSGCSDGTLNTQRNTSSSGALSFAPNAWANAGSSVEAVAVGDFDGDGKPDVVSNYFTGGTFTVKRNNSSVGNISFESALSFNIFNPTGGYGVAVADFDSDGKPDLVTANGQYDVFRVFRNTSNGSSINFSHVNSYSTGAYAYKVVCGDLNGDGKPDMAVTSGNGNNIDVFLNTSTGPGSISFAAKATFAVAGTPWGITIVDLDGDGKLDLAIANTSVSTVSLLRNTSSSGLLSFATKVDLTANGNPRSISAGDLDGDGKPEVIVSTSAGKLSVFHNASTSGTLSFGSKVDYTPVNTAGEVGIADFDGDGKPDIAYGNSGYSSVSVFRNSPAQAPPTITSFTPTSAIPGSSVTITGTNFNTTASNNVVFFGSTRATVTAASANSLTVTVPVGVIYAPITVLNTGLSLAAYSTASFMPTYSGKGSITANDLAPKVNFTTDIGPWTAVMADFDGDGKPDIATANYSGTNSVSVLRNTSTTGAASFATKIDLTAGVSPRYIAVGDVDMDGKPDMVVSNSTFGSGAALVSVFRNTSTSGAISFAAKVDLTATNRPTGIAIGDLDGDGKPDVAVANESSNVVSVFLNTCTTGNVSFAAKVDYATGTSPEDVVIADLDGDGKPDIAVANQSSNTVSVLRNNCTVGELNFFAKADFSTASSPFRIVVGDIDGDGKQDLAVSNVSSASVSVLRNTSTSGTISFATKADFTTSNYPYGLGIGDLDGDGKPDLVTGGNTSGAYASILKNTSTSGTISFASKNDYYLNNAVYGTIIGDVDGDNKPDLVTTNVGASSVSVILNSPAPAPPVVTSFSPVKAAVGASVNINGSGFSTTAANNIVFFGDTKATVTSASATSLTVTVPAGASFSVLSVLNTENKMTGFSSDRFLPTYSGKGTLGSFDFDAKVDVTAGSTSVGVVTGDLDGDGKPDMATGNYDGNNISVYRNTGSSGVLSFATKIDYAANTQPRMITMGDLTGDGKPELAVVHTGSSIVSVYKNASTVGTLSFDAKIDFTLPSISMGVLIADVDMDGKPDLLVSNQSSSSISIFQNISGTSGNIMLAPRVDLATSSSPFGISVGDIDGDGKPDIAVSCGSGISVLRNTGSLGVLSFAAKADFTTGSSPQGIKLVDLDGDGKLDLATACFQSNTYISLLRNTSSSGTISFATKIDYTSGTNPFDLAVGDFDGDGKPDLVASNQSTSTVSVYRNQSTSGTVSFATKVDMATASVPNGLAAADMDGDGKVDIVTACQSSLVSVIRNNPIIPPPTITSFTPNKAAVGATVNITGTNFSTTPANNIVFFGATQATVSAATATSLTVTVPTGATYAPITVLNTEIKLAAYSAANFMPTYSGTGTILATDFSPKVDFSVGSNTRMAAMGDLDGDGKPDLAVTNGGFVSIFRNTGNVGTASFAAKVDYATSNTCATGITIADMDADGKPDVIVTVQCSGNVVSVFKNTSTSGSISFAARKDFATIANPPYVFVNDIDLDGKPDIILGGNGSDKIGVFRNTSSGTTINFAAEQTFGLGDGTGLYDVKIGDLDGDGLTDVVFLSAGKTYFTVLRNTGMPGAINFATPLNVTAPGDLRGLSIGDIDGDGKMDIAVTRYGYSAISAFRNTSTIGTISFASRNDFAALSTNISVMMGDLDGNGKLDLAVTDDTSDNKISLYSNTCSSGSISFATKVDFATGNRPYYSGLIGDVDGDNRPDLVTVNYTDQSFSVLRNNTALPPTITSFTPTSAASGATVTITGTDFTGATAVKFGGTAATSFNVVNSTTITAVVATGTTGSVTVTTLGGTGTKAGFTFIPAPVISSFTPTSSGNGLTVTITGTDFTGATAVSFGGTAATSFNVVNATTITAVVGTGTSGIVSVTTPGGTGTRSGFTWVAKPVISYASSPITATYGVAITNASPTITGTVTSYSISPTLPTGLSFNTSSGVISGTPTMILAQTDYTVSATNAGGTGTATVRITIDKKPLTITGVTAANREYDGTLTATLSGGTASGVVSGDNITVTAGTGAFADKYVGIGKTVTASGYSIGGTSAGNYILTAQPTGITANITQRSLTVTGATADNKVYDGNTTATFTGGTLNNKVGGENVTLVALFGNFNNKNVGTAKAVDVTSFSLGGTDFANYRISPLPTGLTANITAKQLTVSGATTADKVYDGTATASLTGGSLVGIVGAEVVSLTQAATFADKNAGTAKAITANCSISGAGASNYTVAQPTLTARDITAKTLTITATGVNKQYDGNATATVTLSDNRVLGDSFTASYGSATFPDKLIGTGKTVSVSGITITGTDAANYSFNTTASTSADITAKMLTVTPLASDKEYDGSTTANVSLGDNRVSGDELTVSHTSATFNNKNVGTGKTVTVSGISISGTDAGNYTVAASATTTATITAKTLVVTATATDKVYDATTAATTTLSDDRVSGDNLTLSKTSSTFDTKDVGTGKTVTVSGISKSGTDAGNYVLGNVTATTTANTTQKALAITATGVNKQYDGNATATVTLSDNRVLGDSFTASYGSATFPDKLIGTGKTVSVSGITITGTDAANYSFNTTTSTSADITAKTLTVTPLASDKEYDGSTTANVSLGDNRVSGDELTVSHTSATFNNKNVGTGKTVTVSGISISGTDAGNYTVATSATTTATITAKTLAVTTTATDKVYDATTAATTTLTDDRVSGDNLTLSKTSSTFDTKDVGTGKTVTVSGISKSGTDAGNYVLGNVTATTTANITQKALAITASGISKQYDGNATATVTLSDNRVSGDSFTASYGSATFPDKLIGTGKTVSVSGITITGTDAANYSFNTTASTSADITAKTLTITATGINKVYDQNTTATVSLSDNRVSGDVLTSTYTSATFNNKNVGTRKPVSVSGISISGTDIGNYTFNTTASTVADITTKPLNVTATAISKVYDGSTTATVTLIDDRISGDVLTSTYTAANFADKNVDTEKEVTITGISISGTDAANYEVNQTTTATADITFKILTIAGSNGDKVYDGTANTTVTLTDNRVSGDDLTISYTSAKFPDKNVGTAKKVTVSGISMSGEDVQNYMTNNTVKFNANITQRPLTVTDITAANRVYDATTTASLSGGTLSSVISGDDVTLIPGTGAFVDKNAGSNKAIVTAGYSIGGTSVANYILAEQPTNVTGNISQRAATIEGVTANNKVYDGTTVATLVGGTVSGVISGDNVTITSGTGAFSDRYKGTSKQVTASGYSLSGTDGANYTLAAQPVVPNADITGILVTIDGVTASDKTYDGTDVATLNGGNLVGVLTGDDVTIVAGTGSFNDKTVGSNKTVTATGYSLGGTLAANYTLSTQPTVSNAAITKAPVEIVNVSASNKVYDATTVATLSGGTLSGVVTGDVVTITDGTGSFADKRVGTTKAVTATGYAIGGSDASNYTLSGQPTGMTADITSALVDITGVTASNKVYDATTVATLSGGTLSGVITGDVVSITDGTGAFADKTVGNAKPVTATGYGISGADASNYTLSAQPSGLTADITAVTLDITGVTASNKVYDGTTAATMNTGSLSGILGTDDVTLSAGSANFADKAVGTAKGVTASGFSLTGTDAVNYVLSGQPSGLSADITAALVDITGVTASNKVYDATTVATLSGGTLSGVISGDVVTITDGTGSFADKSVGTAKAVTATGYAIGGSDASNYTLSGQPTGMTADITSALVDITGVTASNKVYDATTVATLSGGALSGVITGDVVSITDGTGAFADKTVGNAKPVTATGYGISGADASNYTLSAQPSGLTADITAVTLDITGVTASNKVYDGTTAATMNTGSLSGILGTDDVTLSAGSASFADKSVGTAKPVTASGFSLTGTDAVNYVLSGQPSGLSADITAALVDITGVTASNKVYDATTVATLSGGTLSGVISGDVVTITDGTGSFADKSVGTAKAVTATGYAIGGADASNYTLAAQPSGLSADISTVSLTITGITASNKVYNANTVATLSGGTLSGVVSGDVVSITDGTGAFADKTVGNAKPVTATGYGISGADASNYTLSAQPSGLTADITAVTLDITGVTASNKVYDGTTAATMNTGSLSGILGTDNVTLSAGSANFADKAVGTAKGVTASGFSLTGTDAVNYVLSGQPSGLSADITAAQVAITGVTASNKVYDATTVATLSGGTLSGVISGDVVTITDGTGSFADKSVGTAKAVTATGYAIGGSDASNYTLSGQPTGMTADITSALVDITGVTASNKVYDATTVATLSGGTLSGVITGDVVNITDGTGSFANKTVGTSKVVTATGYGISGADAGNYTLSAQPSGLTADITGASLTITAQDKSKTYGSPNPEFTLNYAGLVGGETINEITNLKITCNANVSSKVGKYSISLSDGNATNYQISLVNGILEITKAILTVTAEDKIRVVGGSNPEFTITYQGFVNNETINAIAELPTATSAANAASPAGEYPITVSGGLSDNYTFKFVSGKLLVTSVSGDSNGDGKITDPEKAGDTNGDGKITDPELAGDTNGDGKITDPELAGDTNGDGKITDPEKAGDTNGDGKITSPEIAGDSNGDGKITDPELAGDTNGDGKITYPEIAGDSNGDGKITDPEKAGDTNGDGKITSPEIAGDSNGDGKITDPELAGDTNGDGKITYPEIAGDSNGDGKITDPEKAGDTNGDGKITSPEIAGDTNGDGKITDPELAGDTNGDGKITDPEKAGDTNGDGKITYPEIAGDSNGDGKITDPEKAGDTNGDGKITDPELAGDTNGDGKITSPEILGDTNGDGKIGNGETAGDANGDGKIGNGEISGNTGGNGGGIAGDTNGDGKITYPEIAGDTNGDGKITYPEIAGDTNGDGKITDPELAGDTNGDGKITSPEILGDTNGDGKIGNGETAGDANGDGKIGNGETSGNTGGNGGGIAGDTNGDGKITYPEIAGDTNGDGKITDPEKAGDTNGDGKITYPEIAGDTNGDGKITSPEILGDTNGDGKIGNGETAGDANGDGKIGNGETSGNTGGNGGGIAGDTNGDGKITYPEIAGDTNGDGKITDPELAGDTNGDGKITSPEILGDTNGDGKIGNGETAGDANGDGKIGNGETSGNTGGNGGGIAGDTNGDGKITYPEIAGDTNGDGKITDPELAGDTNGDGKITSPEILGDTNGDGKIGNGETAGDANGDGKIGNGETSGNTGGNGGGIAGDTNGDGKITYPEIAGDINGDGKITDPEIAGDTNGDGKITSPEIKGDVDGDGHIDGNEIAGDSNGDGTINSDETRVFDPDKDHLNVSHLFSPNGDGINDYWKLPEIEQLGRVYLKIYDRWGTLVYESTSYQNDWDGTSKGKAVPEGGYIYFIKTEKAGNKTGVINIIR